MAYAILTWSTKEENKVGIRIETIVKWKTTLKGNATQIWFVDGTSMVAKQSFDEVKALVEAINSPRHPPSIMQVAYPWFASKPVEETNDSRIGLAITKADLLKSASKKVAQSIEGGTPDYLDLGILDELTQLAEWAAEEIKALRSTTNETRGFLMPDEV